MLSMTLCFKLVLPVMEKENMRICWLNEWYYYLPLGGGEIDLVVNGLFQANPGDSLSEYEMTVVGGRHGDRAISRTTGTSVPGFCSKFLSGRLYFQCSVTFWAQEIIKCFAVSHKVVKIFQYFMWTECLCFSRTCTCVSFSVCLCLYLYLWLYSAASGQHSAISLCPDTQSVYFGKFYLVITLVILAR